MTGPGVVTVVLDLVPESIATVAIAVAAAGDDAHSPLSSGLDVTVTTDVDGFRWTATGLRTERAAILAELYRRNGSWKLRNVSAGWELGLPALFNHYGVSVDDGADTDGADTDGADTSVETTPELGTTPELETTPEPGAPLAPPTITGAPAVPVLAVPPRPAVPSVPPRPAVDPAGSRVPAVPAVPVPVPVPAAKTRSAKKRIAWAAAVLVAVLVLAGILGRKPDSTQNTAQPAPVAAPVAAASSTSSSAATSAVSSPSSSVSSTVRSTALSTVRAEPLLVAPLAVPVVRTSPAAKAAVLVLQKLPVKGRAAKTGYSRALFGQAWTDDAAVDGGHNGCDTRNDILRRDLRAVTVRANSHGCAVTAGTLVDAYTGRAVQFSSGRADAVQIDHVVALSDAWQTGAAALSPQQRQDLANDPLNLQATAGPVNQAKGDGDAATWLPPDKGYRCTYVARQVAVKARYGLWVTTAERQAISTVLTGCGAAPATPLPKPTPPATKAPATRAPVTAAAVVPTPTVTPTTVTRTTEQPPAPTTTEQPPAPTTEESTDEPTTEESTVPAEAGVYYANCSDARAAHVTPLHTNDPGYRAGLDRDHDGVACE